MYWSKRNVEYTHIIFAQIKKETQRFQKKNGSGKKRESEKITV